MQKKSRKLPCAIEVSGGGLSGGMKGKSITQHKLAFACLSMCSQHTELRNIVLRCLLSLFVKILRKNLWQCGWREDVVWEWTIKRIHKNVSIMILIVQLRSLFYLLLFNDFRAFSAHSMLLELAILFDILFSNALHINRNWIISCVLLFESCAAFGVRFEWGMASFKFHLIFDEIQIRFRETKLPHVSTPFFRIIVIHVNALIIIANVCMWVRT